MAMKRNMNMKINMSMPTSTTMKRSMSIKINTSMPTSTNHEAKHEHHQDKHEHADEHDHEAKHEHQDKHEHAYEDKTSHADISASYSFSCDNLRGLKYFEVNFFDIFSGLESIKGVWVSETSQGAAQLTDSNRRLYPK